ncbi:hypothetical protein [Olivibacter sp. XZL3]|uniref:hypothetical protein n=1 Tax=Olivibacter sp. XZL3 TaxID=1735116 RepID=UPI0010650F96|nr:hypothetical protein [Olivibacter sp. XZL3]
MSSGTQCSRDISRYLRSDTSATVGMTTPGRYDEALSPSRLPERSAAETSVGIYTDTSATVGMTTPSPPSCLPELFVMSSGTQCSRDISRYIHTDTSATVGMTTPGRYDEAKIYQKKKYPYL